MTNINLEKAREVLPYGALNELSQKTGLKKCDISRILNGLNSKSKEIVRKEVVIMLREIRSNIDHILTEF